MRLAGFANVGMAGGNIVQSGTRALCSAYCENLSQVLELLG